MRGEGTNGARVRPREELLEFRLVARSGRYRHWSSTYFAASNSLRASSAPLNPIFEWVPSQNGLFVEAPQRQSDTAGLPSGSGTGLP